MIRKNSKRSLASSLTQRNKQVAKCFEALAVIGFHNPASTARARPRTSPRWPRASACLFLDVIHRLLESHFDG